jgi:hypothetical protein
MAELTPEEIVEEAQRMSLSYERQIKNQRDSITRLLVDPDAATEIAQLNELLAKEQGRVAELEEYISRSTTSTLQVDTEDATDEDPAVTKTGETDEDEPFIPPTSLYRPVKSLPSL